MINHNIAYLVCNLTGKALKIFDVAAFIKEVVSRNSTWCARNHLITKFHLTDCHGKSLCHLVEEAIAKRLKNEQSKCRFNGSKRGSGSLIRHPKTTAELRAISGLKVDGYAQLTRGRRNQIPTSYDDLWIDRCANWKKHRRTQYK